MILLSHSRAYIRRNISQYTTETPASVFIAALFTIAKIRNQLVCPAMDEWIKRMWHTYLVEYYSAIKKNEAECWWLTP
jgi:hypothetical protein